MSTKRKYVVDRIEGELIVLVDDESGDKANLDSWELPAVDEGSVLAVELDKHGKPQWGTVVALTKETERRQNEGEARIEKLKKRDPGGNVTL